MIPQSLQRLAYKPKFGRRPTCHRNKDYTNATTFLLPEYGFIFLRLPHALVVLGLTMNRACGIPCPMMRGTKEYPNDLLFFFSVPNDLHCFWFISSLDDLDSDYINCSVICCQSAIAVIGPDALCTSRTCASNCVLSKASGGCCTCLNNYYEEQRDFCKHQSSIGVLIVKENVHNSRESLHIFSFFCIRNSSVFKSFIARFIRTE
jgi:hypothetical protein